MLLCKLLLWRQKKLLVLKGTKIGKGKSTWDWPVSLELVGAAIRLAQVRPFRQQLWHLWKRAPMLGWPDLWRVIWRYLKIYEVCNYTNNSMFFIWSIYMGHSLSQNLQLETHWKHGPTGRSNFLSPVKKDCDDWRQILVEASCERSVGESLQQVSSCNDCLKIVFAQLKCWSRYIYIYTCYIYYIIYMLYPDFMLYIHTACTYI